MADKLFGISLRNNRVKWLLVAGLAGVLWFVITGGDGAPPDPAGVAAGQRARRPAIPVPGTTERAKVARFRWNGARVSDAEFEQMLQVDPFARKPALQQQLQIALAPAASESDMQTAQEEATREAAALAVQHRLKEFQAMKIHVVLRNSDGTAAALLGKRIVREGQVLDGVRILSISTDGIVVEAFKASD